MGALSPKVVRQMAIGIGRTQSHELSCDEVYDLLDLFADMIARGEDAATLMPLVQHHLEMCPDCREEYETLLRSLEATRA
jgi:predicted anti-sigma-YlaC factor YlaD